MIPFKAIFLIQAYVCLSLCRTSGTFRQSPFVSAKGYFFPMPNKAADKSMKGCIRVIVVYHSKTGFSKKYAQWIAAALHCDAVADKDLTPQQWQRSGSVIYGGGLMAGKIHGFSKIRRRPDAVKKLIAVFAVGATPKESSALIEKIPRDNFTSEEGAFPFFYFEGGLNYGEMGFLSKKMLKMMRCSLEKKEQRTAEEEDMLRIFADSYDHSNKESILPLIEYVEAQRIE